jgi:DNA invertase Pin-like site-specific DNA recombinase
MAVVRGDDLVEMIVDEGESAKSLKREGVQMLMRMIEAREIEAVIIAKLDRLTRNLRDLADILDLFDKHNVALVSVAESLDTKSASGRLVINIMCAVSQWEREAIGERTQAVMDFKKSRGERLGNIPYGFRDDGTGKLVQDDDEQEVLKEIRVLRANDHTWSGRSLSCIAEHLNELGYKTRRGGKWRREYVSRILRKSA